MTTAALIIVQIKFGLTLRHSGYATCGLARAAISDNFDCTPLPPLPNHNSLSPPSSPSPHALKGSSYPPRLTSSDSTSPRLCVLSPSSLPRYVCTALARFVPYRAPNTHRLFTAFEAVGETWLNGRPVSHPLYFSSSFEAQWLTGRDRTTFQVCCRRH
jgi:hypothetical protein